MGGGEEKGGGEGKGGRGKGKGGKQMNCHLTLSLLAVTIEMKNSHGYLSAIDYPALVVS